MNLNIGQKVSYPNHGVCAIESLDSKQINGASVEFYLLRVLANNSVIFVPKLNANSVGIRPVISSLQCSELMNLLTQDFIETANDWKIRVRDYSAMIQTGNIFEVAKVLKQLTFLTYSKQLSFREQRLFEKARFLVISELAVACAEKECDIEKKVDVSLAEACQKHLTEKVQVVSGFAN
jgi:CarD family transcriptional regulator